MPSFAGRKHIPSKFQGSLTTIIHSNCHGEIARSFHQTLASFRAMRALFREGPLLCFRGRSRTHVKHACVGSLYLVADSDLIPGTVR